MSVKVTYYSDVLCIWAYVAQARVDAIKEAFGRDVSVDYRFIAVFGDARGKIATGWRDRGGADGYNQHVMGIAKRFPHVKVDPRVWIDVQPASSSSPHLFLAALRGLEPAAGDAVASGAPSRLESVMWAFRRGFFEQGRDVGHWDVQAELAKPFGVDIEAVSEAVHNGTAFATLSADYAEAEKLKLEGSPSFVLNEGRQKLFGNVGFRIIEANIREMMREPSADQASWC